MPQNRARKAEVRQFMADRNVPYLEALRLLGYRKPSTTLTDPDTGIAYRVMLDGVDAVIEWTVLGRTYSRISGVYIFAEPDTDYGVDRVITANDERSYVPLAVSARIVEFVRRNAPRHDEFGPAEYAEMVERADKPTELRYVLLDVTTDTLRVEAYDLLPVDAGVTHGAHRRRMRAVSNWVGHHIEPNHGQTTVVTIPALGVQDVRNRAYHTERQMRWALSQTGSAYKRLGLKMPADTEAKIRDALNNATFQPVIVSEREQLEAPDNRGCSTETSVEFDVPSHNWTVTVERGVPESVVIVPSESHTVTLPLRDAAMLPYVERVRVQVALGAGVNPHAAIPTTEVPTSEDVIGLMNVLRTVRGDDDDLDSERLLTVLHDEGWFHPEWAPGVRFNNVHHDVHDAMDAVFGGGYADWDRRLATALIFQIGFRRP